LLTSPTLDTASCLGSGRGYRECFPIKNFMNAQYLIDLEIGDSRKKMKVVPDTGSSNIWVYSSSCWTCASCWTHHTYRCGGIFGNSCIATNNSFSIEYGSGAVSGYVGKDQCGFGNSFGDCEMGLVNYAPGMTFAMGYLEGIVGFGLPLLAEGVGTKSYLDSVGVEDFAFFLHDDEDKSELCINDAQGCCKDCNLVKHDVLRMQERDGTEVFGYWTIAKKPVKIGDE